MKGELYALVSFVAWGCFVYYLEWRENYLIDSNRRQAFDRLDDSCLSYLRHTKDRPIWRLAWVCAILVTIASSIIFAACMKDCNIGMSKFCAIVFIVSAISAQSVLSYYNWHILCPEYTCSLCEATTSKSEK